MPSILDLLIRPVDAAERLDDASHPGRATVLATGVLYALFCVFLAIGGERPSFTGVPIPANAYYWVQAGFVIPLFWLAWRVGARTACAVAGVDADRRRVVREMLGVTWGLSMSLAYVIPDLLVYTLAGFDALVPAMRLYGPVAFLGIVVLGGRAVSASADSAARAWPGHVAGVFVQSVIIATLLR